MSFISCLWEPQHSTESSLLLWYPNHSANPHHPPSKTVSLVPRPSISFCIPLLFIKDFLQEHTLFAVHLHTTGRRCSMLHKCFICCSCSLHLSRDNQHTSQVSFLDERYLLATSWLFFFFVCVVIPNHRSILRRWRKKNRFWDYWGVRPGYYNKKHHPCKTTEVYISVH